MTVNVTEHLIKLWISGRELEIKDFITLHGVEPKHCHIIAQGDYEWIMVKGRPESKTPLLKKPSIRIIQ